MKHISSSRHLALRLVIAAFVAAVAGCGGDEPCEIVCTRNAECQVDAPSEDECLATCNDLSEDEAYADALDEQADCYEDESCEGIARGVCTPDYS